METKIRYINPWVDKKSFVRKSDYYENYPDVIKEYRDVQIYSADTSGYHFVFKGMCITHRGGITDYKTVIDDILDGEEPCVEQIAQHLIKHGFKGLSYEQYIKDWQKGLRE